MTRKEELKVLIKDVKAKLADRADKLNKSEVSDDTEIRFIENELKQLKSYFKSFKRLS